MIFTIQKAVFLKGLRVVRAIPDRSSMTPILSNIVLRSDGTSKILLGATDLTVSATAEIPAKVLQEGGITLPAKGLYDIVREIPGDEIKLTVNDTLRGVIKAGRSEFKLPGLPEKDFPSLPDAREVTLVNMDSPSVRNMISKTVFAASQSIHQAKMAGVYMDCDETKTMMAAMDSARLAKIVLLVSGPKLQVMIPRSAALHIKNMLEGREAPSGFGVTKKDFLVVRADESTLYIKLLEAIPGPYDQAIGHPMQFKVMLPRAAFMGCIDRVLMVAKEDAVFKLESNTLSVTGNDALQGEADEQLDVEYSGPPAEVTSTCRYVRELLSHMDSDKVVFGFSEGLAPIIIKQAEGEYAGCVMPKMPVRT